VKASSWAYGKMMGFFDWLDSPAGRLPMTALMVVIGLGLIISDERAAKRWRR